MAKAPTRKRTNTSKAVSGAPDARALVYVHGIGNKPTPSVLKCQWDTSLFGAPLGERSRMAYWVNREYYPTPLQETCAAGDRVDMGEMDVREGGARALKLLSAESLEEEIGALNGRAKEAAVLRRIAERIESAGTRDRPRGGVRTEVLPLPAGIRRWITRKLTRAFLRDVNDFLFVEARRRAMEQSLAQRLESGGGPFTVVAHSQGTLVAYEVLRKLKGVEVGLFVTLGSPLGIQEVQDVLRTWAGARGKLPKPACVQRWVNVADWLDPVAADKDLSNDFAPRSVENHVLWNPDSPRSPHSATGYLRTAPVQSAVRETLGIAFAQAVGRFVVAKDLVGAMEDAGAEARHPVLIELAEPDGRQSMEETRAKLTRVIEEMTGGRRQEAEIEPLRRYLAARLTRSEVERLRARFGDLRIHRFWRDAVKRALIRESVQTVQARPAHVGYGAKGKDVHWAVLDTGIRADHPHFAAHGNVGPQWDCTRRGAPKAEGGAPDRNGHGTHVAGIIAGELEVTEKPGRPPVALAGMAPEATLHVYKVLDDQGEGQDSWIIKALDHIADANDEAGSLVIHGLNLSLGGSFDPSVYGCGHSPLCQELRRLWRQGVVVCVAAGNEGFAVLESAEGELDANLDLSVGDPANLEEAIAVGSVHKTNPHTYGVSYFSSRGPTADGRRKPDVVAPGERVVSAAYRFRRTGKPNVDDLYVEMSGTSMATPHVSGVLAAFLSLRREFIGFPDRVKKVLLQSCTDLDRDPYIQGHGLPNLIRMLVQT